MSSHKLVFNIERANASTLRAQARHDDRRGGDLSHTSRGLRPFNRVLVGTGKPLEDAERVIAAKGAKVRKDNTAPFDRVVLSASPELFEDAVRASKWLADSLKWLRETWGDGLAYARLHMDERTPHIHAVIVPLVERKDGWIVSHCKHKATGGRNSYEALRRSASAALSLDYGEQGNKPQTEAQRLAKEEQAKASRMSADALDSAAIAYSIAREREVAALEARAALDAEREKQQSRRKALDAYALELEKRARSLGSLEHAQAVAQARQRLGVVFADPCPQRINQHTRQRQRER